MIELKEVIVERVFTVSNEFLINSIAIVVQSKKTNELMKILCDQAPLQLFQLGHLKRVRRCSQLEYQQNGYVELLLCSESYLCESLLEGSEEEEIARRKLLQGILENAITHSVVPVSKHAPESKKEFELWNPYWPINFHPNELERIRNKTFTTAELDLLSSYYLPQLQQDRLLNAQNYDLQNFGTIIINPERLLDSQILCSSHQILSRCTEEERQQIILSPILSPVLLCIEDISKISRNILPGKEKLPKGDYLCTGLDCLVYEELDVMSAMALVHSRIRHVYYIKDNALFGCFKSTDCHLHCLKTLNHHYRVFQFLDHSKDKDHDLKGSKHNTP